MTLERGHDTDVSMFRRNFLVRLATHNPLAQPRSSSKVDRCAELADEMLRDDRLRCEGKLLAGRIAYVAGDTAAATCDFHEAVGLAGEDFDILHTICHFTRTHGDTGVAEQLLDELVRHSR